MNICGRYHDEIVYTSKKCPLCATIGEIEDLMEQAANLGAQS